MIRAQLTQLSLFLFGDSCESENSSRDLLSTLASRMIGPGSGLCVKIRDPVDVMPKEKKHLRKKVEEEANDTMVILDQAQEDALQKIKNNMGVDSNNVQFCNPPIPILADLYKV